MNAFEEGLFRYFKDEELTKIQQYKIGIAGCGGLGSNIANILVRSGIKNFELVDYDIIDASNLNRQNYFLNEIGLNKVDITAKRLTKINPDSNIKTHFSKISDENIHIFFNDCDIIFEAFDDAASKKMILEYFRNTKKILILGNGMAGLTNTELKIRKINNNIYIVGDGITNVDKTNPPFAPRVIMCASMMALVALNIILGKKINVI